MPNTLINERLEPLVASCRPLRVSVKLRCRKDRYYIHIDGSNTYKSPDEWDQWWISFENYVIYLINQYGFSEGKITMKDRCYAIVDIGSLFDFLKANHDTV